MLHYMLVKSALINVLLNHMLVQIVLINVLQDHMLVKIVVKARLRFLVTLG